MTKHILFSISITCSSWLIGMILNELIKNQSFYSKISNLNFIKEKKSNTIIGIGIFKWIVKNTPLKYLNQKLTIKTKVGMAELNEMRKEMTFSEISHLIGFGFITVYAGFKIEAGQYLFALILMIVNTLLNLYPSLLQQENKRRIDRLIKVCI